MSTDQKPSDDNKNLFFLLQLILIVAGVLTVGIGMLYYSLNNEESLFQVSGSNTLGQALIPELAKNYMANEIKAKDVKIRKKGNNQTLVIGWLDGKKTSIQINSKGTSTGFTEMTNGKSDITMASRPFKENERSNLLNARKGDISIPKFEHIIAMDGIVVMVHPNSPIQTLTLKQLANIFSCNIKNWSEIGGQNAPIDIYIRADKSGTHHTFKNKILNPFSRNFCTDSQILNSNKKLAQAVSQNPNAISFVPLLAAKNNKIVRLKNHKGASKAPSLFEIALENYPLSRRLYLYNNEQSNQSSLSFINYCLSDEGQSIVDSFGFISLNPESHFAVYEQIDNKTKSTFPEDYRNTIANSSQVPVIIRFYQASLRIDSKGIVDLKRISQLLQKLKNKEIHLLGFSDNQKEEFIQKETSVSRADAVKRELTNLGIDASRIKVFGLGNSYSVVSNKTEMGRIKNRRVEIWLK